MTMQLGTSDIFNVVAKINENGMPVFRQSCTNYNSGSTVQKGWITPPMLGSDGIGPSHDICTYWAEDPNRTEPLFGFTSQLSSGLWPISSATVMTRCNMFGYVADRGEGYVEREVFSYGCTYAEAYADIQITPKHTGAAFFINQTDYAPAETTYYNQDMAIAKGDCVIWRYNYELRRYGFVKESPATILVGCVGTAAYRTKIKAPQYDHLDGKVSVYSGAQWLNPRLSNFEGEIFDRYGMAFRFGEDMRSVDRYSYQRVNAASLWLCKNCSPSIYDVLINQTMPLDSTSRPNGWFPTNGGDVRTRMVGRTTWSGVDFDVWLCKLSRTVNYGWNDGGKCYWMSTPQTCFGRSTILDGNQISAYCTDEMITLGQISSWYL